MNTEKKQYEIPEKELYHTRAMRIGYDKTNFIDLVVRSTGEVNVLKSVGSSEKVKVKQVFNRAELQELLSKVERSIAAHKAIMKEHEGGNYPKSWHEGNLNALEETHLLLSDLLHEEK